MELKKTPALLTNKFVVNCAQQVRLFFGESFDQLESPEFHSSVFMSREDARELAKVITETIDTQEGKENAKP